MVDEVTDIESIGRGGWWGGGRGRRGLEWRGKWGAWGGLRERE